MWLADQFGQDGGDVVAGNAAVVDRGPQPDAIGAGTAGQGAGPQDDPVRAGGGEVDARALLTFM
jgi:hypothetical protein